jgi:Uma2 family endonuclease
MRRDRNSSDPWEQLKELPDYVVGEIVHGQLVVSPRPATDHAYASSTLGGELMGPFQHGKGGGPGGWWILDEPELHFDKDVLVPDLAGWRRERMPEFPQAPAIELAPDWVCEVISPSTARVDRVGKREIYAREGVQFLWFIDPLERTLEVFGLEKGGWLVRGAWSDTDKVRAAPFDAIELDLSLLWPPSRQES